MRLAQRRSARLSAVLLAVTLSAAACGEGDSGSASDDGGSGGGEGQTISVSGSSTVAPITTRVAELYEEEDPAVTVNVDGPGTGDGFQLFCDGETDISDASRPIQGEEAATCEENGIEFIELKVGIDGLTVMTNPANDAVECLNFADLYALVGPESQGFENWSDAADIAAELDSDTELPDAPLTISGPGEESGTYDSFVEIVIEDLADERGEEPQTRPDYSSNADDNAILQGVQGADTSLGWVGYAYAEEAGDSVKALAIADEPGGECVEPTPETVADGTYPIARDLYIYVNAANVEENPDLEAFVDYYLADGMEAVSEVGYIDLEESELEATREVWESKETGTRDGGE